MNVRTLVLGAAVAGGLSSGILAAEPPTTPTVDERLERVEQDVRALRDSNLKLRSELGADTKDRGSLVRASGQELALTLGGLLQVQADGGDKGDVRFGSDRERIYLRRARINATAVYQENLEVRLETELAGSLSEANAMRAQLTDGYVQWKAWPAALVRLGQFKTPFGFEQLAADPRLYTIERSLGNDRLTLGRQIGAQLGGDFLDRRVSYAAGAFNGTSVNSSSNDNSKFTLVGRVSAVPLAPGAGASGPRLAFGLDGYVSDDDQAGGQPSEFKFNTSTNKAADNIFAGKRSAWGADAQFALSRFELWSEYLKARYEPDNKKPADQVDAEAWYVQATWYLVPSRLQALVKYDAYDPNDDVANDETDTWTFGLNYYVRNHDIKLQLDYLSEDVASSDSVEGKVLARMQVMF